MTIRPTKRTRYNAGNGVAGPLLQRKCGCGNHTVAGGQCDECGKKKHALQRETDGRSLNRSAPLQTKLTIGSSNDPLEHEADRIANQILATPATVAVNSAPPRIQRHTGQSSDGIASSPASVDHVLASPGMMLDQSTRQDMERRFGHDFSRVRVHSGTEAAQSARDVMAKAYTVGHDIVFAQGRFVPGTSEGRRLIAHELTHVVQQTNPASIRFGVHHDEKIDKPRVAGSINHGARAAVSVAPHLSRIQLQREPDPNKTPPPAGPYTGLRPFPPSPPPPPPPPESKCFVSDECSKHIPGSAWDFAHQAGKEQETNQKDLDKKKSEGKVVPKPRQAKEILKFAGMRAPEIVANITDIVVNPAIGNSAGAQYGECNLIPPPPSSTKATCIEIPDQMENEAAVFNAPANQKVGGMPRADWEFDTIRKLTHEVAHAKFDTKAPAGLTTTDQISMFELDELNALLSEFPRGFTRIMGSSRTAEEKAEYLRKVITNYIEKPGEGIRGVLKKLRCLNPCSKVDVSVKKVFQAQTASWAPEAKKFYLDELTKPERKLDWPR